MQGRLDSAETLLKRALSSCEHVLGEEHPATLRTVESLARLHAARGNHEASESSYRRVLEISKRVLGREHPATLATMHNLALLLHDKVGDLVAAEPLYRCVLDATERMLGHKHPDALENTLNLALLLEEKGNFQEAEPLYRRAIEGLAWASRRMGRPHPELDNVVAVYADVLRNLGLNEQEIRGRIQLAVQDGGNE
jgi:tetratricopeptide (TPR) repeat protein